MKPRAPVLKRREVGGFKIQFFFPSEPTLRPTSVALYTIAEMDFDDDSSSEMQFDEGSSSEIEFEEDAEHFDVNDSNVHFVVRPFDDAAEKAELILNNTLTRMKKQDKGPTTESETAYLVTLKSNLIELIRPGYDLVFAKCTREILVVMCTYRNRWKVQLQNPLDVIKCKFLEGTTKD